MNTQQATSVPVPHAASSADQPVLTRPTLDRLENAIGSAQYLLNAMSCQIGESQDVEGSFFASTLAKTVSDNLDVAFNEINQLCCQLKDQREPIQLQEPSVLPTSPTQQASERKSEDETERVPGKSPAWHATHRPKWSDPRHAAFVQCLLEAEGAEDDGNLTLLLPISLDAEEWAYMARILQSNMMGDASPSCMGCAVSAFLWKVKDQLREMAYHEADEEQNRRMRSATEKH